MTDAHELHPEVDAMLRAAGWSPERSVDTGRWTAVLEREGFRFPPAVEALLARFGGLSVAPPPRAELDVKCDRFDFDPVAAAGGELDRFAEWQSFAGRELAPVGAVADWILCADAEGELYIGSHGDLEALGPLPRALAYLCLGEGEPRSLGDRG